MKVSDFYYELPESSIAQEAIEPRHSSRLLDSRDMVDHRFLDLPALLEPGDLVIANETRVRAARVKGVRRGTGGGVEFLFLGALADGTWETLARPARRLRSGVVVEVGEIEVTVVDNRGEGLVIVEVGSSDAEQVIAGAGSVPLPPYFVGRLADSERYQTVFANTAGSAAAPTAGLHFTGDVLAGLEARGVEFTTVDLHVSLDTFRPMSVEQIENHVMHREWCTVSAGTADAVARARRRGGRVVAVGTTVVRTLESFADGSGGVTPGAGDTDIFLRPGSVISVVDLLVTNFHLPGSTLLVLLEAFMGPEWRQVYATALDRGYRFLSFGDAMLCQRATR